MLRGGGMNTSHLPQNVGAMTSGKKVMPSGKGNGGNPIATATKGAERYALNDYGKNLVDRANNTGEELK
jgi:predicted nicotinamide N-methyase